jgi:hypothetical protein
MLFSILLGISGLVRPVSGSIALAGRARAVHKIGPDPAALVFLAQLPQALMLDCLNHRFVYPRCRVKRHRLTFSSSPMDGWMDVSARVAP